MISHVVKAEAAPARVVASLLSSEKLLITWSLTGGDDTATKNAIPTLTVDGTAIDVKQLYGWKGGHGGNNTYNWAGVFGPLSAGTHNFVIDAKDAAGHTDKYTGTLTVVSALMVDAPTAPTGQAQPLASAQLQPIVSEAERRLAAALGSQVTAALQCLSVRIADLPHGMLGEAVDKTICLSPTAAGYGWFVDSTPADDAEFAAAIGADARAAQAGSPAANRVDLLTTVMHEMSHLLGYEHSGGLDLMHASLPLGERLSFSNADAVDHVFASSSGGN
jgi:hypothetical protein